MTGMAASLTTFKFSDFSEKKRLGSEAGQFGDVYVAAHPQFPKVAVRIVSDRLIIRPDQRARLFKEAKSLSSISSEHVIRLLGIIVDDRLGLVFEYAEFGPLDKAMRRHKMGWPLKIRLAYDIAVGMYFLHSRQILHLRLKCRNILISGTIKAKISDLFLYESQELQTWSEIASQSLVANTHSHGHPSTTAHIPPECYKDIDLPQDKTWDVYAYAIIIWELLTERTPYEGVQQVCRKVAEGLRPDMLLIPLDRPLELYQIMEQGLQANKDRRPSFKLIVEKLKIALKPVENDAITMALECQKVMSELCHPIVILDSPEGDLCQSTRNWNTPDLRTSNSSGVPADCHSVHSGRPLLNHATSAIVESSDRKNCSIPTSWFTAADSSRHLNANDMYIIARTIANDFRAFGKRVLKLKERDIDALEEQHRSCGEQEIAYQMLRLWKETSHPVPTISFMVKILFDSGYSDIVSLLPP